VNKSEYDEGYEALMRVVKKTRKLAALSGTGELSGAEGGPSVVDAKKPLLSSTSMALLSKAQDRPRGGGLAAGRAMAAAPGGAQPPGSSSGSHPHHGNNNSAFAAYALREKQVRMQMQTAATIVTAPPLGGEYGDSDGDGENRHPKDRPRTTGGLRPSLKNTAGTGGAGGGARPASSVDRAPYGSPPRMPEGEAMGHVGAAVAGAGFNVRSPVPLRKDKLAELMRHSSDNTDPDVDVMATRVQGVDGKFYHS
jgi:hypothetical protein